MTARAKIADWRREGREAALQMVYAMEINGQSARQAELWFWPLHPGVPANARSLAERLLSETEQRAPAIAECAGRLCPQYPLAGMTPIDRALLRLGLAELLSQPETPPAVVIHEFLRLCKQYSRPEMGRLLNAVLDAVTRELAAARRK